MFASQETGCNGGVLCFVYSTYLRVEQVLNFYQTQVAVVLPGCARKIYAMDFLDVCITENEGEDVPLREV